MKSRIFALLVIGATAIRHGWMGRLFVKVGGDDCRGEVVHDAVFYVFADH